MALPDLNYVPVIPDDIAGILDNLKFHSGELNWERMALFVPNDNSNLKSRWEMFKNSYSRKLKYALDNGYIRESEQSLDNDERTYLLRERYAFFYNNFTKKNRQKRVERFKKDDPNFDRHVQLFRAQGFHI